MTVLFALTYYIHFSVIRHVFFPSKLKQAKKKICIHLGNFYWYSLFMFTVMCQCFGKPKIMYLANGKLITVGVPIKVLKRINLEVLKKLSLIFPKT